MYSKVGFDVINKVIHVCLKIWNVSSGVEIDNLECVKRVSEISN